MSSTSRPHELLVAASIAIAIVFCWINAQMAYALKGANGDFGVFFLGSAQAFLDGRAMYGAPGNAVVPNLNPPHLHLLLLPLAHLSRPAAFAWWMAGGVICLALSLRIIFRETSLTLRPWTLWIVLVALVSAAATTAVISTGQVAWILMLPVTAAWSAARRARWGLAGVLIGVAASIKLFLIVLIPYLLLARRWRAAAYAVMSAGVCFAVGLAIFGVQNHLAWIRALQSVSWAFLPMNASVMGTLTRSLSVTSSFANGAKQFAPLVAAPWIIQPLWLASSAVIGLATLAAVRARSAHDVDRSFALLLTAALLISPLGWIYYTWLAIGPLFAVAWSWRSRQRVPPPFLAATVVGFFWPIPLTMWLQPSGGLTATIGSAYFWGLLSMWIALVVDRSRDRGGDRAVA